MNRESLVGAAYATAAFSWWGMVPLYWNAVRAVPSLELVAHRVLWGVPVLAFLVARRGRTREVLDAVRDRRHRRILAAAAVLLCVNWLVFIWAVQRHLVLESSLGYYANPLVNVVLGALVLRERLRPLQWAAVASAATGVLWLTVSAGSVPWIALTLAVTFSVYGLLRKQAGVDSLVGLTTETIVLVPFALAGFLFLVARGKAHVFRLDPWTLVLVLAAGAVTVIPLLWFTHAARRLRYVTLGFFQYLSPTGQFLLAVFVFGEPFGTSHAVAFAFIWAAVALYVWESVRSARSAQQAGAPAASGTPALAPAEAGALLEPNSGSRSS